MTLGLLPLARPTFDVAFAEEKLTALLQRLDAAGVPTLGPRTLLFDADATRAALTDVRAAGATRLLILQVTFTDAAMTLEAAATGLPLSIWAVPEPRLGGRLRLNAFCGLNLASHALGRNGRDFAWAYADADTLGDDELADLVSDQRSAGRLDATPPAAGSETGRQIAGRIAGRRIARIGEHPVGFDTCAYAPDALKRLAGVDIDEVPLAQLFDAARALPADAVAPVRTRAEADVEGLDAVDAAELDRSLRLKVALDGLQRQGDYAAFAIRCWPETFTEYGGAVCGPVSMLGEARVPCACEADVYGALTQLILQEVADAPVFLTDLVDVDTDDDSAVIWHCGQAPVSMRDTSQAATATIHTNRRMPLLYQFPLKPGRITLARVSQAFGEPKLILAGAEMLQRPMAFTGTSGVLRFDRPATTVLPELIASGVEHHMAIAYGEHRPLLHDVAAALQLPVLEL